jgi:hypothetical protein
MRFSAFKSHFSLVIHSEPRWRYPSKKKITAVVLGLGFYGRSFTLKDPSCNKPGCPFSSGAEKGECTGESGILSNSEIQRIMSANNVKPFFDKEAGVKWISWGSYQWVSYDDAETLQLRIKFANGLGLAGTSASNHYPRCFSRAASTRVLTRSQWCGLWISTTRMVKPLSILVQTLL